MIVLNKYYSIVYWIVGTIYNNFIEIQHWHETTKAGFGRRQAYMVNFSIPKIWKIYKNVILKIIECKNYMIIVNYSEVP